MRIAITGAGVLTATASDLDSFSRALRQGRSGIARRPGAPELGPQLSADLPDFDFAAGCGDRREALRVAGRAPRAVQASVLVALQAWRQADLSGIPPERTGLVVAGHNLGGRYADLMRPKYDSSPVHLPGRYALHFMDTDHVGVVSQILGIQGEGFTVGGASASGNVAIVNAARLITSGEVDACLVIGAMTDLSEMERQAFLNLGAMAADGQYRPFDVDRGGFVPGQGAACLVLEREPVDQPVLGWLHGWASRLDGNSLADPTVAGETRVMLEALARAGVSPAQVGYVNAHGTGSPLGDLTELKALDDVFATVGEAGLGGPWVNSTKGLTGHCLCAAGVVEAVATVLQLRDGFVHPNARLSTPLDSVCRLVGAHSEPLGKTYAISNSFGFGGFNTSLVIGPSES